MAVMPQTGIRSMVQRIKETVANSITWFDKVISWNCWTMSLNVGFTSTSVIVACRRRISGKNPKKSLLWTGHAPRKTTFMSASAKCAPSTEEPNGTIWHWKLSFLRLDSQATLRVKVGTRMRNRLKTTSLLHKISHNQGKYTSNVQCLEGKGFLPLPLLYLTFNDPVRSQVLTPWLVRKHIKKRYK